MKTKIEKELKEEEKAKKEKEFKKYLKKNRKKLLAERYTEREIAISEVLIKTGQRRGYG